MARFNEVASGNRLKPVLTNMKKIGLTRMCPPSSIMPLISIHPERMLLRQSVSLDQIV